jgi:hypothetical protein
MIFLPPYEMNGVDFDLSNINGLGQASVRGAKSVVTVRFALPKRRSA